MDLTKVKRKSKRKREEGGRRRGQERARGRVGSTVRSVDGGDGSIQGKRGKEF